MKIVKIIFLIIALLYVSTTNATKKIQEENIKVTYVPNDNSFTDSGSRVDTISSWLKKNDELPSNSNDIDKLANSDLEKANKVEEAKINHIFKEAKDVADIALDKADKDIARDKAKNEKLDKEAEQLMAKRVDGLHAMEALDQVASHEIQHAFDGFFAPDITDEFAGGEDLFEQFFPGAIHHRRRRHDGFLSSIIRGIENSVFNRHHERYGNGMRHGRNPNKRWNSADHKHKSPKQCCCQDIHKFCKHVNTDGGAVGFYKVMKCLADRQRTHKDVHPLCVKRLDRTVAGNCAADIDRVCSNVQPGNNALHKCLLKHQNDGATSGTCQAYLDLVQVDKKSPTKYARAKTVPKGKLAEATKSETGSSSMSKVVKHPHDETATKLVLKSKVAKSKPVKETMKGTTVNNNKNNNLAAASTLKTTNHFLKPIYLVVGIAGVVLIIGGIVLGIKRQRDQMARDESIHYASLQ